jgi:hypothetical protein
LKLPATLAVWLVLTVPAAAEWRADPVQTNGRVSAVDIDGDVTRIAIGATCHRLDGETNLVATSPPDRPALPLNALPDGRVATEAGDIKRAWLGMPTKRYDHGVLGDAIEAGSLVIEHRDGKRGGVTLGEDAVFEDLTPRIFKSNGRDWIVVVKSYLARGSALAIIDPATMRIAAETPPIGQPHAWLNPAGIADFTGHGATEIAFVRQPHVVGQLELWSFNNGKLSKVLDVPDVANHFIGSRALGMSWTADFDGDRHPDLAIPSLDRRSLRIISFAPDVHDIARVKMPARMTTNIGAVTLNGKLALVVGLEDGRLMTIRNY